MRFISNITCPEDGKSRAEMNLNFFRPTMDENELNKMQTMNAS